MGRILAMQIEVKRRAVVGFEHREVFLLQVAVYLLARVQCKEQGIIGVIRAKDKH